MFVLFISKTFHLTIPNEKHLVKTKPSFKPSKNGGIFDT